MKETNNVEQGPRTSLSKGARRNQILRRITVVGVIAAVITAAFAGYCLHRERVEEKQKAEEFRKEKQDKKRGGKSKVKAGNCRTEIGTCTKAGNGTQISEKCDRTVG